MTGALLILTMGLIAAAFVPRIARIDGDPDAVLEREREGVV